MVQPMSEPADLTDSPHFSLVSGGLLFRLFRKSHLCGEMMELLPRRMLVMVCIAWLPLLVLSAFAGNALGGSLGIPFLYDIDAHARFLVALPLLIAAEVVVHNNIWPSLRRFVEREIVVREDLPAFRSARDSALRMRNSLIPELVLLIFVYTAGQWLWRTQIALAGATWYANPQGADLHLTLAGYWYVFLSIPIFQFILVRWYLRLFIWFQLLWRISRLNLRLDAANPDRAGGLKFLGRVSFSFLLFLFAEGVLLAGLFGDRVILQGMSFLALKATAASVVVFWVLVLLAPLMMFSPMLYRAKEAGRNEYGALANRYLAEFRTKWMLGNQPAGEQLLGSGDIQSLADMENTYDAVRQMRIVPFGLTEIGVLAAVTVAPLLPFALTLFSVDQLVDHLFKIIF